MNSTHTYFNISASEIGAKLKQHGSVCPPFWIPTVEWSGAQSCLFLMSSPFSGSIVFSVHTRKQRFQIAPLWWAFSNGSIFGDRFRRCSVDNSRIRSKTAPFSFENGLVWTGHTAGAREIWIDESGFSRWEKIHCPRVNVSWQERHYWNQATFLIGDCIKYSLKGIYNSQSHFKLQKVKNMKHLVSPSF